jgi:hypothetical protein
MSISGDDAAATLAPPSPPPPPTAAEIMEDSCALSRRMLLNGWLASLESFRFECACSSGAAGAPAAPEPLLLLRRLDAADARVEGTGRMPEMGAAQRGQVVSPEGKRAAMRVRKHLKCMR